MVLNTFLMASNSGPTISRGRILPVLGILFRRYACNRHSLILMPSDYYYFCDTLGRVTCHGFYLLLWGYDIDHS